MMKTVNLQSKMFNKELVVYKDEDSGLENSEIQVSNQFFNALCDLDDLLKLSKLQFPDLKSRDKSYTKTFIVSWFLIEKYWQQLKCLSIRHG